MILWLSTGCLSSKKRGNAAAAGARIVAATEQKVMPGVPGVGAPETKIIIGLRWNEAFGPIRFLWRTDNEWLYGATNARNHSDSLAVFFSSSRRATAPKGAAPNPQTFYYQRPDSSWTTLRPEKIVRLPPIFMQ